jgi:hypothetical protein
MPAIEKFLHAIEAAAIPGCDAWAADATLDATVPNWRLHAAGADAIRAEYARWFADPAPVRGRGGQRRQRQPDRRAGTDDAIPESSGRHLARTLTPVSYWASIGQEGPRKLGQFYRRKDDQCG